MGQGNPGSERGRVRPACFSLSLSLSLSLSHTHTRWVFSSGVRVFVLCVCRAWRLSQANSIGSGSTESVLLTGNSRQQQNNLNSCTFMRCNLFTEMEKRYECMAKLKTLLCVSRSGGCKYYCDRQALRQLCVCAWVDVRKCFCICSFVCASHAHGTHRIIQNKFTDETTEISFVCDSKQ